MATFTAVLDNGLSFNVKARTLKQASAKVSDLLLEYPKLSPSCNYYVCVDNTHYFDGSRPFITMTSSGYTGRYKINPNTNKKYLLNC
jgi:hypothetical protein